MHNIYLYILIMAAATYIIRMLPFTLFRKEIKNITFRSFSCYDFSLYSQCNFQHMVRTRWIHRSYNTRLSWWKLIQSIYRCMYCSIFDRMDNLILLFIFF